MHDKDILGFYSYEHNFDLDSYIPHSLWKLENYDANSFITPDRYFDKNQSISAEDVIISFKLKRQPLYFMTNNIFPSLILNCVTLLAFSLPFPQQISLSNSFKYNRQEFNTILITVIILLIGMTTFMTFSVYSVRISNDMPVESNYVPMVTLYFMLGISYAFVSMIWFIIANEFRTRNHIPNILIKLAAIIQRIECRKTDALAEKILEIVSDKEQEKAFLNKDNNIKTCDTKLQKINFQYEIYLEQILLALNKLVTDEQDNSIKEKDKKLKKDTTELNVSALNHFMCFIMFITVLSCNLYTWLMISFPPYDKS